MSTLPGMVEIDDMVNKSRVQLESLLKIREVVLAQQAAHDQQAAEQRQQQATPSTSSASSATKIYAEHNAASAPSLDLARHQHQQDDREDARVGFAGADSKKRRGRAAPPGRCHSCNRAETPEWRRGPDGARTLCNACGLHYAKLTRKANSAANKSAAAAAAAGGANGGANLRPKEGGA